MFSAQQTDFAGRMHLTSPRFLESLNAARTSARATIRFEDFLERSGWLRCNSGTRRNAATNRFSPVLPLEVHAPGTLGRSECKRSGWDEGRSIPGCFQNTMPSHICWRASRTSGRISECRRQSQLREVPEGREIASACDSPDPSCSCDSRNSTSCTAFWWRRAASPNTKPALFRDPSPNRISLLDLHVSCILCDTSYR